MLVDFIQNPAFPRAIVLGLFGGIGLALTAVYSRRGPTGADHEESHMRSRQETGCTKVRRSVPASYIQGQSV